ncbi:BLUF domain-containing protein [Roseibacterium sp. SDUM158017]|uniref:BLUF domain-containing protein n=1 Tax=Roseicyclus salinarum TaxID=3036773 RepID=UPI0024152D72|nr:BLUF domain-containing protein [Roseibacterium sp. SDUM158017]MDG4649719.1 BLUF domain-containing protein [Roseibacterium sp. SDUM158017]
MVHQIAYVSASHGPLDEDALSAILDVSRRNNERDGITGVLLYHDRIFFQTLEGSEAELDACFGRIRQDPRHSAVSVMWQGEAERREFPDWTMGYAGPAEIGRFARGSEAVLDRIRRGGGAGKATKSIALSIAREIFSEFSSRSVRPM